MKRLLLALLAAVFTVSAVTSQAQEWAKARVDKSPRHSEYVKVKAGDREVNCFLSFPEVKDKATAVIVIHEIFGLTDWVRSVCDQLSEAGYIAIAPDLLSGAAPGGGGTAEMESVEAVRRAISSLPPDQVTADLNAVALHVAALPASNAKVVVGGFCWGGTQTFRFATANKNVKLALVFYGSGPDKAEEIARIEAPVLGFYAENDARINATIPKSEELMKAASKTYEPVTYPGAGHGFMRAGEDPAGNEANKKACEEAWKRVLEALKKV